MILQGTVVNVAAVAAGSLAGRYLGQLLPERIRHTVMVGLGLAVILVGLSLALQSRQVLVVIGSLILGGLTGELLRLEDRLEAAGRRLKERFKGEGDLAEAFVTASLLYCVGAMAVMGSIQDGLGDRPSILYAKSALDGIASVALASTLGIGVIFSTVPLLLYQGGITLAAGSVKAILTGPVVAEMNAVGGLLIFGIALDLLGIRKLPVGNLLPSVFMAPALMRIVDLFSKG